MNELVSIKNIAYKVLRNDGSPFYGGKGKWDLPKNNKPGKWMPKIEGNLVPCEKGYHLCRKEDLRFWLGEAIFEAEYKGKIITCENKIVVSQARLIKKLNWDKIVAVKFAVACAERVLPIFENKYPKDERPRKAIQTTKNFINNAAARAADATDDYAAARAADDAAAAAADAAARAADAADAAARAADVAVRIAAYAADAADAAARAADVAVRIAAAAAAADAARAAADAARAAADAAYAAAYAAYAAAARAADAAVRITAVAARAAAAAVDVVDVEILRQNNKLIELLYIGIN